MKIGTVDLGERPVTLAPMEDVTDASFRILCREAGAAMVTTEFVSSDGLVRDVGKTIAKMPWPQTQKNLPAGMGPMWSISTSAARFPKSRAGERAAA